MEESEGVCFFSRVPAGMLVADVRRLFAAEGVGRVFLRPYPRGAGPRRYRDGYAEFASAAAARAVAEAYNAQPVGGKKSGRFHDDLWCLRFEPGLRWAQLVDGRRRERRIAEHRARAELGQAARVHDFIAGQRLRRPAGLKGPREL